jgi:hypothetical protein
VDWKQKSAAAIVAGGLVGGAGDAQAQLGTNLVGNPSFEAVTTNNADPPWAGAVHTYAYSSNYTQPGLAGSGARYWHGGTISPSGTPGSITATQAIDLVAAGFTPAQLDGGLGYNLSAFFSNYRTQGDYGEVNVVFQDALGATLGTSATIGGQAFNAALPTGPFGNYTDARAWGQDATSGSLPIGARSALVTLTGTKVAVGSSVDGYIDVVNLQLTAVPEPGTAALAGGAVLGGIVMRTRRRKPATP